MWVRGWWCSVSLYAHVTCLFVACLELVAPPAVVLVLLVQFCRESDPENFEPESKLAV